MCVCSCVGVYWCVVECVCVNVVLVVLLCVCACGSDSECGCSRLCGAILKIKNSTLKIVLSSKITSKQK